MAVNRERYESLSNELKQKNISLVAVSKTQPIMEMLELYKLGQRDFGENYVQELEQKFPGMPPDVRWHFIGHLQTNKVKTIAPFVHLIHGVDSLKLLKEINKQGSNHNRVIDVLLQVHIAHEETKFGLDDEELHLIMKQFGELKMEFVRICGLMGMSTLTENREQVRMEFRHLKTVFDLHANPQPQPSNFHLEILSMGMSSDYSLAIEEGSTMVRIGSLIFGERAQAG